MIGIELVADPETRRPFDLSEEFGTRIPDYCRSMGALIRNLTDTFIISRPLTLQTEQVDVMVDAFDEAIAAID